MIGREPQVRARRPLSGIAALACATCLIGFTAARADSIDRELLRQTPKVMNYLKQKGYKTVGVLTARVQRDDQRPTMRGSLLHNNMADRLENALVLTIDPENPIQIIGDARNSAGAQLKNASYRTPADRKRLFDVKYRLPLAAERRYVWADAFVTGKVAVSKDYQTTTITIEAFDKRQPQVYTKVIEFDVNSDRYIMADLGQGFSLSRKGVAFMRGALGENDIIEGIKEEVQSGQDGDPPSENSDSSEFPVKLTVRYEGKQQTLSPDSGLGPDNWTVTDPLPGEEVAFDVENRTNEKIGLVVTVNGTSTLYLEQGQADQLTRWILEPHRKYRIKGFHNKDRKTYQPIVGLTDEDSESLFEDLGGDEFAGLIHLYVFREQDETVVAGLPGVSRGSLRKVPSQQVSRQTPRSWPELQKHVAATMAMEAGRGLMAAHPDARDETLKLNELPAVNLTDVMVIRYYQRKGSTETPAGATEKE